MKKGKERVTSFYKGGAETSASSNSHLLHDYPSYLHSQRSYKQIKIKSTNDYAKNSQEHSSQTTASNPPSHPVSQRSSHNFNTLEILQKKLRGLGQVFAPAPASTTEKPAVVVSSKKRTVGKSDSQSQSKAFKYSQ